MELPVDYGGYVVIAIFILAGVFFALALYNRGNIKTLRFTSFGLAAMFLAGCITYYVYPSTDLKVSLILMVFLSVIYLWFYRGSIKDGRKK